MKDPKFFGSLGFSWGIAAHITTESYPGWIGGLLWFVALLICLTSCHFIGSKE